MTHQTTWNSRSEVTNLWGRKLEGPGFVEDGNNSDLLPQFIKNLTTSSAEDKCQVDSCCTGNRGPHALLSDAAGWSNFWLKSPAGNEHYSLLLEEQSHKDMKTTSSAASSSPNFSKVHPTSSCTFKVKYDGYACSSSSSS